MLVRYTKYYHRMQGADLVVDLLNDPRVQQEFQVGSAGRVSQLDSAWRKIDTSRSRTACMGTGLAYWQYDYPECWLSASVGVWHDLHSVSFTSSSPMGIAVIQVLNKGGQWGPLGSPVGKADIRLVASSLTRCAHPPCAVDLDPMHQRVMCACLLWGV